MNARYRAVMRPPHGGSACRISSAQDRPRPLWPRSPPVETPDLGDDFPSQRTAPNGPVRRDSWSKGVRGGVLRALRPNLRKPLEPERVRRNVLHLVREVGDVLRRVASTE